jgi:hypothetical protein
MFEISEGAFAGTLKPCQAAFRAVARGRKATAVVDIFFVSDGCVPD